jgi:hypothetical protein
MVLEIEFIVFISFKLFPYIKMVFKLDMSKVLKLWKIWDISTLVGAFFIYVYLGVYNYDIV